MYSILCLDSLVSCECDHWVLVSTSIVVVFCSELLLLHTSVMIGFLIVEMKMGVCYITCWVSPNPLFRASVRWWIYMNARDFLVLLILVLIVCNLVCIYSKSLECPLLVFLSLRIGQWFLPDLSNFIWSIPCVLPNCPYFYKHLISWYLIFIFQRCKTVPVDFEANMISNFSGRK